MSVSTRSQGAAALTLAAGGALLLAAPAPNRSLATLRALTSTGATSTGAHGGQQDAVAGVLAALSLGAWMLVAYLAAVVLLTWATRLPRIGTLCAEILRQVAPAALRSAVAVTIGAAVVVGSTSAASAAPASLAATSGATSADPGSIGDLDWPVARTTSPAMPAGAPTATPTGTPSSTPGPADAAPVTPGGASVTPASPGEPGQVVVQTGDTLWGLAAESLPADASDAAVAAAWPQWWEANRAVIGEDPDLLWPGQVLQAPA